MIKEIEDYLSKEYYKLLIIAKKYTKNDDWSSELLHEVILQLYNKEELNIKLDDNSIKYYIIRMLMVNWTYPSSPFYRKHKRDLHNQVDLTEAIEMAVDDTNMDTHRLLDLMEEEFQDQPWFEKNLFELYLIKGSLKKVSVDTKIPLSSIGKYIKETRTKVKLNTFKRYNNGM